MVRRFFSPDSFWNTPIGSSPETDPRSDKMLEFLVEKSGEGDRGFWINLDKWTIPIYDVDERTPLRTILPGKAPFSHGVSFENPVPWPENANPDPLGDAHIAIIDWNKKKVWDMWLVYQDENGQWHSNTGMTYALDGDGIFDPAELPIKNEESAHYHGPSRAAAVPAIAGLIMHDEILAGKIEHKLAFATCANALQEHLFPARWTDGRWPGGIPEGCVIQLDPDLDLKKFDLSPAALTVARALQEYGAVDVDNSGGKTLYGEGLYNHPSKSWQNLLGEDELTRISMSHYRILKMENIVHLGDDKEKRRRLKQQIKE